MAERFDGSLTERIGRSGVLAVLVIDRVEDAVPLANALLEGGIDAMELTLRTPAALGALKAIRANVPEMLAGIGTILTPEQAVQVKEAGGAFGVSPGLNRRVVEKAWEVGLPFAPGVATPSDIEAALEYGMRLLKFFPAEPAGGMAYLKSMNAPYAHLGLRYVPLGGLHAGNMRPYLADPMILAVGGSWLAKREQIAAGDWAAIAQCAREAVTLAQQVRGG